MIRNVEHDLQYGNNSNTHNNAYFTSRDAKGKVTSSL